jgi:hypothetical protein
MFNAHRTDPIGFVTIAAGPLHYAEMAVDMALSLRQFHDQPRILLADAASHAHVTRDYHGIFDQVVLLPDSVGDGRRFKFRLAAYAPLAQAVFIDADIIVLRNLDAELAQCGRAPMQMMGRFVDAGSGHRHHGIKVSKLCRLFAQDRFFTCHSGCFIYDRDRARPILQEAEQVFDMLLQIRPRVGPFIGDELAFGIAAARLGMAQMDHPYPVIWSNEFANFDLAQPSKPLLHFHETPPAALLRDVLAGIAARRVAAGLDPAVSQLAWRKKIRRNALDPVAFVQKRLRQLRGLIGKGLTK